MAKTRTFIAVELSAAVQRRAADLVERLRVSGARVSWVAPQNMHLTLKFLGDQSDEEIAEVCRAVGPAIQDMESFEFLCFGAGAFPANQRPRTLWIGVREGTAELQALQDRVEAALAPFGYPREHRQFRPHLTLGRVRAGNVGLDELARLLAQAADWQAGCVAVDDVVVFSSLLQRDGPRYEVLARFPLEG